MGSVLGAACGARDLTEVPTMQGKGLTAALCHVPKLERQAGFSSSLEAKETEDASEPFTDRALSSSFPWASVPC